MRQIGLIASGVQEWYSGVICCLNDKFVYCSTLALYIYRLSDYTLQRILTGHEKAITGIAKSPFVPNLVVTTSLDKTMKLWDVENGKMIKSINIDGDFKPISLAWNPHSQFEIAVGGKKGQIRIYNYNSSKYKLLNLKSEADIQKVKYNPKSQDLFVFLQDGTIVLANTLKNSIIYRYKQIHESGIDFSFDPHSNNYVICAYKNGQLSLYDTDKPGEYFRVGSEFERRGGISCVAFLEDEPGSFISGDMRTGVIMYWNVSQSTPIKIVKIRKPGVRELYPIRGEKKFLISFKDGAVGIYDYKLEKLDFITNTGHTETIFDCAFCACNPNILATSSYDGTIKLWDISTMKEITSLVIHGTKGIIYGLAWHPTKMLIAGAVERGAVHIWDVEKNRIILTVKLHNNTCFKVDWNPIDPSLLASTSKDHTCVIFRDDGKLVKKLKHPDSVFGVHWSPLDRNLLATGCHDFIVRVYNLTTSFDTPVKKLIGHEGDVFNVRWHPTLKNVLMSGSNDKTVRIWNIETGDCKVLRGHTNFVRALSWNPEIPYIALSGSWDGTIRVWDVRTGECLHTAYDHHADVYGISFHPQRPFIFASSSRDTTVRFWTQENTFGKLFVKFLTCVSYSEVIGDPALLFTDKSAEIKLCGSGSKNLIESLKQYKTIVEKNAEIINFFSMPYGQKQLWELAQSMATGKNYCSDDSIMFHKFLIQNLELKAKDLEASKSKQMGIGVVGIRRCETLEQAANIFLSIGKIDKYCELMVELGDWDKAIAVAPAVSVDYWRSLCVRYANKLAAEGKEECIPYYIATKEIDKLLNYYVSRNQLKNAMRTAIVNAQDGYKEPLKMSQSTSPETKPTKLNNVELTHISERRAFKYLQSCLPVFSACCYLSIQDARNAIRMLLKGGEVLSAYALMKSLNVAKSEEVYISMALFCEAFGLWQTALDLLLESENVSEIMKFVSRFQGTNDEIEKLHIRAGLQPPSFYKNEAQNIRDIKKKIQYYSLGRDYSSAAITGCQALKDLFSESTWNWDLIKEIADALHCIDATKLEEDLRAQVLAYVCFVGAQIALWKGYHTIAPFLIKSTRSLISLHKIDSFGVPKGYLDYMLCLATSFTDRNEALNLLNQVLDSGVLNAELRNAAKELQSELQSNPIHVNEQLNVVIPTALNMPQETIIENEKIKSLFTGKHAKSPIFKLNNTLYITFAEALMWYQVNPFSPLLDGSKINPFAQ